MKHYCYNKFFNFGQQEINFNLYQIGLPEDDTVYTSIKILKELNFEELLARYSYYKCHNNRKIEYIRDEISSLDGFTRKYKTYALKDCGGCDHKSECLYRYDEEKDKDKNKLMKISEDWEELKRISEENVLRRFNHRTQEKNYKEIIFNIIG